MVILEEKTHAGVLLTKVLTYYTHEIGEIWSNKYIDLFCIKIHSEFRLAESL